MQKGSKWINRRVGVMGLCLTLLLSGCSIPFISSKDRVKPDCEYREVFSVARVTSNSESDVTFKVSGYRSETLELSALPDRYAYQPGDEYNVRQRFITKGDCEPYILEILSKL